MYWTLYSGHSVVVIDPGELVGVNDRQSVLRSGAILDFDRLV